MAVGMSSYGKVSLTITRRLSPKKELKYMPNFKPMNNFIDFNYSCTLCACWIGALVAITETYFI